MLVSCGGGGNSGSDDGVVVQSQTPASFVRFADSRVQLFYPDNWLLNTPPEFAAQFLAPTENQFGGNDNCTLDYTLAPNSSLVELTDDVLEFAVSATPEPSVSFLTVNGRPAARVNGFVQVLTFSIPAKFQMMYEGNTGFLLVCLGSEENAQTFQWIIDSMELL